MYTCIINGAPHGWSAARLPSLVRFESELEALERAAVERAFLDGGLRASPAPTQGDPAFHRRNHKPRRLVRVYLDEPCGMEN